MNRILSHRALAVAVLAAAAAGCDNGLTELNVNPNEPVEVGAEYLFPNATEAAVSRVLGQSIHMDITALWVQQYAESRYSEEDRYEITDSKVDGQWGGFYAGPLQDFNEVIAKGQETDRPNLRAMGTVMQSWTFQAVTDLWGDIGYSDALRGRDPDAGLEVKLDPQEQVYAGLLTSLRSAAEMIDPAGPTIESADLIYQGEMEKWRKFANSLRMRVSMRLSEVDPSTAASGFQAAYQAGGFTSNDDNALLRYVDNNVDVNPLYAYQSNRDDHAVSATMVDTLTKLNDPRLAIYARQNAGGDYKGMPNGDMSSFSLDSISRIGTYFSAADAPGVVMSYAEVLFLEAEAAERGWIAADPAALYEQGIAAAMEMYGVSQSDIDAYLAQARVQYQGGDAGLHQIWLQKWIALFGNGPEAYAEWRRTGYPVLVAGPDAINGGKIPVRLPYPASEEALNRANVAEAVSRQGGATLNDPVWWDK
ncbi:MAG TPA: SusD/RagB family nutrient-binding outer membrane lipoprotein [Longimicrobiaceae bacterium]|nr:SusD/RagB family nutrient-binding outer membrane lipoprotein [Longimicrobiaceae bacterium]